VKPSKRKLGAMSENRSFQCVLLGVAALVSFSVPAMAANEPVKAHEVEQLSLPKSQLAQPMMLGFAKLKERRARASAPRWRRSKPAPEGRPSVRSKAAVPSTPLFFPQSGSAYRAQVWAKLAAHRPKLGLSGSATVIFTIGPSGALRSVRIARSSGNAALDERARDAVRNAAPFPAPLSGLSASYLIQIYFS
jgi:protein TonB